MFCIFFYLGQDHSLLIDEDGGVWGAGWGADGQTGLQHYNNTQHFTKLEGDIKVYICYRQA